jgi:hypothetical protein
LVLQKRGGGRWPNRVDALHIYRHCSGFLYGHGLDELQEIVERPEEADDVLWLGPYRLPITEFPMPT